MVVPAPPQAFVPGPVPREYADAAVVVDTAVVGVGGIDEGSGTVGVVCTVVVVAEAVVAVVVLALCTFVVRAGARATLDRV